MLTQHLFTREPVEIDNVKSLHILKKYKLQSYRHFKIKKKMRIKITKKITSITSCTITHASNEGKDVSCSYSLSDHTGILPSLWSRHNEMCTHCISEECVRLLSRCTCCWHVLWRIRVLQPSCPRIPPHWLQHYSYLKVSWSETITRYIPI